jgi:hypothetical protein
VTVTLDAASGFVIEDNTATIERLRVDEATGNISRNGALFVHTTGSRNLYVGENAGSLFNSSPLPSFENSAFGWEALTSLTTGDANSAFGARALHSNTSSGGNSAFGWNAMEDNTDGFFNVAFGASALPRNTTGFGNTAIGTGALRTNTTGYQNVAVGSYALRSNNSNQNVALGYGAMLSATSGGQNVAIGNRALEDNTTGHRNIAIGVVSGRLVNGGVDNIHISNGGLPGDTGQIKIGNANHTHATIQGIFGNTSASGSTVRVNSAGVLGTTTSSARFKRNVEDMGESSDLLAKLRPVRFHYREEVVGEAEARVPQYGLIAEEVAEVAPEIVTYDDEGQPYSVRYEVLGPLLLNEMQKQQRVIEAQRQKHKAQEAQIQRLHARLDELESHL